MIWLWPHLLQALPFTPGAVPILQPIASHSGVSPASSLLPSLASQAGHPQVFPPHTLHLCGVALPRIRLGSRSKSCMGLQAVVIETNFTNQNNRKGAFRLQLVYQLQI